MQHESRLQPGQLIVLHGGAGPTDPKQPAARAAVLSLTRIAKRAYKKLEAGDEPAEVASYCCYEMECDPLFNAGVGSALQADGVARLSAALMDGQRQTFSGVVSASYLSHPSTLALTLQKRTARVLTNPGTELLARQLSERISLNLTAKRAEGWLARSAAANFRPLPPELTNSGADTVGCVLRTEAGRLVAAASTGGRGFELPGRVSDTCTVAGTYASKFAAVAATGIGEQIVDDALASRLETRVRDGAPLLEASERCFNEALKRKRAYGWIALDRQAWSIAHTTPWMPFVIIRRSSRGVTVAARSPLPS